MFFTHISWYDASQGWKKWSDRIEPFMTLDDLLRYVDKCRKLCRSISFDFQVSSPSTNSMIFCDVQIDDHEDHVYQIK